MMPKKPMASIDRPERGTIGRHSILFVATTPFAVNAFLASHLVTLSEDYRVFLCVNLEAYELMPLVFQLVEVKHIPFVRKTAPCSDLKHVLQLLILILKVKPVAIHSITPKAGLLAMMAGFVAGVPNRWHTFTGQVWATRKGLARYLLRIVDRLVVRLASQVFADSASQCRMLCAEGIVRDGHITTLGVGSIAGVDLARFRPDSNIRELVRREIGTKATACVFLFVGRLARDKGIFDLVEAFQRMACVEPVAELWVVGPDEEALLSALRERATACAAPIRWLGATSVPERYMAAADVLVLPSYREGFGSVIIEGAACGIPAVAYRIDGVADAVVDGKSGLLVELGQLSALVETLQTLARDSEMRLSLGKFAQERVEQEFSSRLITEAWRDYYRRQLG